MKYYIVITKEISELLTDFFKQRGKEYPHIEKFTNFAYPNYYDNRGIKQGFHNLLNSELRERVEVKNWSTFKILLESNIFPTQTAFSIFN